MPAKKPGLYANIHAKQERIAKGSKEKCASPVTKARPIPVTLKRQPGPKNPLQRKP